MNAEESSTFDIMKEAAAIEEELIALRRYFHQHAEQSWQELNTQKKIEEYLDALGIPYETPYKTAVIATIKGKHSSDHILGIRADIDALPITEETGCSFASENAGTMHACGHDTHTAILLAAAKLFAKHRDRLRVTIRLIFQPAEEFIEDSGALHLKTVPSVLACERLIGLHIMSALEAGDAAIQDGPIMASADTFDVYIEGKGGHGAHPEQCIDPIQAGVEFVQSVNRIVARECNAITPVVISITRFTSGTTSNVIPATAELSGTTRTADPALRDRFQEILERTASAIAADTGTKIRVDYHWGCAVTINDPEVAETGRRAARSVFGPAHVRQLPFSTGGEDFSKYTNPKAYLILGGGASNPAKRFPQHSPFFTIEESVLKKGVAYFLQYAEAWSDELGLPRPSEDEKG